MHSPEKNSFSQTFLPKNVAEACLFHRERRSSPLKRSRPARCSTPRHFPYHSGLSETSKLMSSHSLSPPGDPLRFSLSPGVLRRISPQQTYPYVRVQKSNGPHDRFETYQPSRSNGRLFRSPPACPERTSLSAKPSLPRASPKFPREPPDVSSRETYLSSTEMTRRR